MHALTKMHAEEKLRESEEHFRAMFEQSTVITTRGTPSLVSFYGKADRGRVTMIFGFQAFLMGFVKNATAN